MAAESNKTFVFPENIRRRIAVAFFMLPVIALIFAVIGHDKSDRVASSGSAVSGTAHPKAQVVAYTEPEPKTYAERLVEKYESSSNVRCQLYAGHLRNVIGTPYEAPILRKMNNKGCY